ncbi:MAG: hypothetical protein RL321_151 [Pseudomonadota bacterium]
MLCRGVEIRQGVGVRQDMISNLESTFFANQFIYLCEIARQKDVRKITCQLGRALGLALLDVVSTRDPHNFHKLSP